MGLLSAERFGLFTQLSWHCCMLSSCLPCLTDAFSSPMSLSCFCVMLWSAVFHSSDTTALFPKICVPTPGQEANNFYATGSFLCTVPWSALLTSWANWHKCNPYESITNGIFSWWFKSWNTKSSVCWPSVRQYSRNEWCPVATILFCLCMSWEMTGITLVHLAFVQYTATFCFSWPLVLSPILPEDLHGRRLTWMHLDPNSADLKRKLSDMNHSMFWAHRDRAVLKCPWTFLWLAHSKPSLVCLSS